MHTTSLKTVHCFYDPFVDDCSQIEVAGRWVRTTDASKVAGTIVKPNGGVVVARIDV